MIDHLMSADWGRQSATRSGVVAWCAPSPARATPATLDASVSPPCSAHSERMLKRKPTRIELKPEDREEYFAHKKETAKPPSEVESGKPSEKEVRIGLAKAR